MQVEKNTFDALLHKMMRAPPEPKSGIKTEGKAGNPRNWRITKEVAFRIREGIGGQVIKLSNGKPAKTPVDGSIIQSFTPIESFNDDAVKATA